MMRLAHPWFLILLGLLIPMFLWGRQSGGSLRFSSLDHIKAAISSRKWHFHPRDFLFLLRAISFVLLIFALARPQQGQHFSEVNSEGVDIMLALDTSGSMKALDFQMEGKPVERLTVVKSVVENFIKNRPADRMGLVVFGEEAYTQCPLTLDHGVVLDFLKRVEIGMAGDATAIGSGLGVSLKRLKDLSSKSKIVILLTDGRSNAGQIPPEKAAELAQKMGVKVYTIGVGTRGKAPFLVDTFFGQRYVYEDVDIDETLLKDVAVKTKGRYYRALDKAGLEKIYREIDRLEKTEVKVKEYTEYNEIFAWFLIPALILLLLEIGLGQTLLRKIP